MQFTYGVATSTEVAYFTYIYAKVSTVQYSSGILQTARLSNRTKLFLKLKNTANFINVRKSPFLFEMKF
jgi:hypothetical protein